MISAARLGELFGQDPLTLLDVEDTDWVIRMACARVIEEDRKEAQEKAKKQNGSSFNA